MATMAAVKRKKPGSLAAAALIGGLLLSACQHDPRSAATVGDQTIATSDVDLLSTAMCEEREDLAKQGHTAAAPRSTAREEALLALIRVELGDDFAEGRNLPIDSRTVNDLSDQVADQVSTIDDSERPRLRELVRSLLVEQQQMVAVARAAFEAQGQPAPEDPGTLIAAGRQAVLDAEDRPEVSVNPRFTSPQFEVFGVANPALSEPVSEAAKAPSGEEEASVEGLPKNLRCG